MNEQARIQGERPVGLVFPKIEYLNSWSQPIFYSSFYFTFIVVRSFLIPLFFISFSNYRYKMTILIVHFSLKDLVSFFAFIQLC